MYVNLAVVMAVNLVTTLCLIAAIRWEHRRTVTSLAGVHRELERRATHDGLTDALTAGAFQAEGEHYYHIARRYGNGSVIVLDLDKFKEINDTRGHRIGDEALRITASVIRDRLRVSDILGRIGGDEFGIILPNGHIENTKEVCDSLVTAIANVPPEGVTASIGATCLSEFSSWDEALHAADLAMYQAKSNGGSRAYMHVS